MGTHMGTHRWVVFAAFSLIAFACGGSDTSDFTGNGSTATAGSGGAQGTAGTATGSAGSAGSSSVAGSAGASANGGAPGAGGANANLTTSYVDGGQNQIYNSGQEFLEVPQSGIREFKVNISGGSAQYSAIGGVVLTATKTGTNDFHGEAFEFFRNTSLNAMDRFEKEAHDTRGAPKPDYRRDQYGIALGGPIVRNRLHFFGAFERTKEPKTVTVRSGQPQFYSAVEGNRPAGYERRQMLVRGDLQVSNTQNAFLRYLWDKEYTFCEVCGGTLAGNTGTDTDSPRDSLLAAHTWVLSPRLLNEVRSQIPPSHLENLGSPPGIARWPASQRGSFPAERFKDYTGVYVFPSLTWGSTGYSNNVTKRWDVSDDVTLSTGDHTLKGGGAFLRFRSDEESAHNIATWTFGQDQFFDFDTLVQQPAAKIDGLMEVDGPIVIAMNEQHRRLPDRHRGNWR